MMHVLNTVAGLRAADVGRADAVHVVPSPGMRRQSNGSDGENLRVGSMILEIQKQLSNLISFIWDDDMRSLHGVRLLAVFMSRVLYVLVKELMGGNSDAEFDFIVMGTRLGYEDYEPIIDNVDYVPFQGNQSGLDEDEMTTQQWYDRQSSGLKRIFQENGTLDENGKVTKAEIVGEKQGWGFDAEALNAARRSVYKPATMNGIPVKVWHTLAVEFRTD